MSQSPQYRIIGHYVDPYTWQVVKLNCVVSISCEAGARIWAKQTYHRCMVNRVELVDQST